MEKFLKFIFRRLVCLFSFVVVVVFCDFCFLKKYVFFYNFERSFFFYLYCYDKYVCYLDSSKNEILNVRYINKRERKR